jgi:uncharacterized protein
VRHRRLDKAWPPVRSFREKPAILFHGQDQSLANTHGGCIGVRPHRPFSSMGNQLHRDGAGGGDEGQAAGAVAVGPARVAQTEAAPSATGQPLIDAAFNGDPAGVAALLDGPDPPLIDATDICGHTALTRAAGSGKADVVFLLLRRGAVIEATSTTGQTALMCAALSGRREVVAMLLGCGARIEAQDDCGWTALTHAAAGGHCEVVELLLRRGADERTCDSEGRTAEHWAKTEDIRDVLQVRNSDWGLVASKPMRVDDSGGCMTKAEQTAWGWGTDMVLSMG